MTKIIEYWPTITVGDNELSLLSIHFSIDFGGRGAECEFQNEKDFSTTYATYFYLTDNWSDEEFPVDDKLTKAIRNIFTSFDNVANLPD